MIEVEFISGVAIGLAISAILIIFVPTRKRLKNHAKEIPFYDMDGFGTKTEPFIGIPLEKMILRKPKANSSDIDLLKDKIRRFKVRNQFYH